MTQTKPLQMLAKAMKSGIMPVAPFGHLWHDSPMRNETMSSE
jgi:hypothetical protein